MIKIVVSVISDLVTDQRVHRVAQTLHENGYQVLLVGTKKQHSLALAERDYPTRRLHMFFQKGFAFYAEWNIRLFFFLLRQKAQIFLANDLDTLPPNYLVSRLKKNIVVYDTHEYFTETAELYQRSFVKNIWLRIENYFFPKIRYVYTVNHSVARLYNKRFRNNIAVVRNVPMSGRYSHQALSGHIRQMIPPGKKILLVQGSGLNENRGLEELVQAITMLPEDFILIIAGSGLIIDRLKAMRVELHLEDRVYFTGILPFEQLHSLTREAYAGFSLDKPLNLNQQASLPNKIFDYLAAHVPVIVSNIAEVAAIVEQYKVGIIIPVVTPQAIVEAVLKLDTDKQQYELYKQHTAIATRQLNWENERGVVELFFKQIITENQLYLG